MKRLIDEIAESDRLPRGVTVMIGVVVWAVGAVIAWALVK